MGGWVTYFVRVLLLWVSGAPSFFMLNGSLSFTFHYFVNAVIWGILEGASSNSHGVHACNAERSVLGVFREGC